MEGHKLWQAPEDDPDWEGWNVWHVVNEDWPDEEKGCCYFFSSDYGRCLVWMERELARREDTPTNLLGLLGLVRPPWQERPPLARLAEAEPNFQKTDDQASTCTQRAPTHRGDSRPARPIGRT